MTSFEVRSLPFDRESIDVWSPIDHRHTNWPVVYLLHDRTSVYVGETLNADARLRQHLDTSDRGSLDEALVIVDGSYNKSVCLDLESYLIRLFSGEGRYDVLNRNIGITDAEYFDRPAYRAQFDEVFDELRSRGLFSRTLPEIANSALFKLSPFKALSTDQAAAVELILEGVFDDIERGLHSTSVIQGGPGTGKTIVGIFMLKLLRDIARSEPDVPIEEDSYFGGLFGPRFTALANELRLGLVVPQQALRDSIRQVFRKTPGLSSGEVPVMTPFEVGTSTNDFDVLVIDEAHRLNQRANQPSGMLNRKFREINLALFGDDDPTHTQLDWMLAKSKHQIVLLDTDQSVRPADLPAKVTSQLIQTAELSGRWYPLTTQMRVRSSEDYVGYIRRVLSGTQVSRQEFADYDLRFFKDLSEMYDELGKREREAGLARLLAGYAWEWVSRGNPALHDIEIDGLQLRWNSEPTDWVNSPNAFGEVGSIHTIQGYDLNFAGVIIGPDLRFDPGTSRIAVDRANYFDKKGMENNRVLGITYSDEDLRRYITNVYSVLLTRGIRGTYVYVCDPDLRWHLSNFF